MVYGNKKPSFVAKNTCFTTSVLALTKQLKIYQNYVECQGGDSNPTFFQKNSRFMYFTWHDKSP